MIKSRLTSENNKWNEEPDECKVELRTKTTDVMITLLLENRKGTTTVVVKRMDYIPMGALLT